MHAFFNYMVIPTNIRLIRKLSGATQTTFGALFNASKAMIISYETGKALPDDLFVTRLADKVGLSKNILLSTELTESDIEVEKLEILREAIIRENPGQKKKTINASWAESKAIASNTLDLEKKYLDALLAEKERVIAEKEARRLDAEARLEKAEKDKERLMNLLELSLQRLENLNIATLSQLESHIHREATREANGDQIIKKQILEEVNKKAGDFRKALVGDSSHRDVNR